MGGISEITEGVFFPQILQCSVGFFYSASIQLSTALGNRLPQTTGAGHLDQRQQSLAVEGRLNPATKDQLALLVIKTIQSIENIFYFL